MPRPANDFASRNTKPNWPKISSLCEGRHPELIPLLADQILTIPGLLSQSVCKIYVKFLSNLPLTTTPSKPKKDEALRSNDRYQVNDAEFAAQLWKATGLERLITSPIIDGKELDAHRLWGGQVIGLNANIRIYRYREGQFFAKHYDDANNVLFPDEGVPSAVPAKTTWTLLLYLTSPATGCLGGDTVFYPQAPNKRERTPDPVVAQLEVGKALLHKHGKDCLLHEGLAVTKGEKWVIRSDLCVSR
ncbi:hypothetical protein K470DRAFT_245579 [Piedraia hortae CBS 480.64]|uniref:Fe2OG dioxygenase domain-containing protein n=1 Tax=Piedraia hortae CBS 480.64 TaxID=1314780 RepID=A0A6A7C1J5_9PEZI|nr:hypothetical protein K470DRAFT_245579 [Piedraia hortae CBS 480.64]